MKRTLGLGGVVFLALLGSDTRAQQVNPAPPTLSVRAPGNQSLRLAWPKAATGFVLEETERISPSPTWQALAPAPQTEGDEFAVTVSVSAGNRFFRLRKPPLTTIMQSSPADGETGVAVTRETIVHFSLSLADSTVLTGDNFYAMFGGRRILSRIELASDRRKATLLYLEPLPGGARVNVFFDGAGQ